MPDFDLNKIDELIDQAGMDEAYFINNIKKMIDKGGQNASVGLKALADLKGLSKKRQSASDGNILSEFGLEQLMNTVQQNRRLNAGVELAEIVNEHR
jgi:hypothetical protein